MEKQELIIPEFVKIQNRQSLSFGTKEDLKKSWESLYRMTCPEIKNFQFYPYYNDVIEWLSDDKGLGLAIYRSEGDNITNNGVGKSLFINKVYPILLYNVYDKRTPVFLNCLDITSDLDYLEEKIFSKTNREILILEEFSREPKEINDYGTTFRPMERIFDHAERYGWKVIFVTNKSKSEVVKHYNSNHLMDRIRSMCYAIECSGDSSRISSKEIFKNDR